jgi:hypothetical protein
MAEVLGAVAASDQLVRSFTDLYSRLNLAYKTIRHAKKEVKEVQRRTRTMKKLWRIFGETMEDAANIEEFSIDFDRYKRFDRGLKRHAQYIIDSILGILDTLDPLLTTRRVSVWTDVRTRWAWFVRKKEELRLLYVDMKLLAGYMKTFTQLVLVQVAIKQYELSSSLATKVQMYVHAYIEDRRANLIRDSQVRALKAQLRGIEQTQQAQFYTGRILQEKEKDDFLRRVQRIVKQELARAPRTAADDDSSSDSGSHSTSDPSLTSESPGPSPLQGPSLTLPLDVASNDQATLPQSDNPNAAQGSGSLQAANSAPDGGLVSTPDDGQDGDSNGDADDGPDDGPGPGGDADPTAVPNTREGPQLGSSSESDSGSESSSPPPPPPRPLPNRPKPPKRPNNGQGGLRVATGRVRRRPGSLIQSAALANSVMHHNSDDPSTDSTATSSTSHTEVQDGKDTVNEELPHRSVNQSASSVNSPEGAKETLSNIRVSKAASPRRTSSDDDLPLQAQAGGPQRTSSPEDTGDEAVPVPESWERVWRERKRQNKRELVLA